MPSDKVQDDIDSTNGVRLRNPFDQRALPTYVLIAIKATLGFSLAFLFGFSLDVFVSTAILTWVVIALAGIMLRRLGRPRFGGAMEAFALLYGQGFSSIPLLAAMAALNANWADPVLHSWDVAIGFSWIDSIRILDDYSYVLEFCYDSFLWQGWLVIAILCYKEDFNRVWIVVASATLSMLVTALAFGIFPAKAAFVYYGIAGIESNSIPYSFIQPLEYIRGGGREITQKMISGMVTFPSYHAAAGIIFSWAMWGTYLRIPFILLNIGLMLGTILIGGHYLVDILAGALLASCSILLCARVVMRLDANPANDGAAARSFPLAI